MKHADLYQSANMETDEFLSLPIQFPESDK